MNVKIVTGGAVLVAILSMVCGGCARRQDVIAVNGRLTAVGQKVSTQTKEAEADRVALRSEITRYHEEQVKLDEAYRTRHADLHALMNDIREEMQGLRGQMEESDHDARQKLGALAESKARQEGEWKNLEERLESTLDRIVRLEQYLGMEPSEKLVPLGADEAGPDKGKTSAAKTPDELYAVAKQHFDRGEYEDARQMFQTLLEQYPKSENADNAQFWIGEVYYQEKWYERAILEYDNVIKNYPKGNKVHSALLKQGLAFSNLGDADNAKLVLKELVRKYPDSSEAKIAKKKLKTFQ